MLETEHQAPPPHRALPPVPNLAGHGPPEATFLGRPKDGWRDAYHHLLTMPLAAFFAVMAAAYLAMNGLFALIYLVVGGVTGMRRGDFSDAFFFSAETMSTVGYGTMSPASFAAHVVVTAESFVGLFNLAIATGLLFARISRPTARVIFSRRAVVANFDGGPTLMFRAANRRRNRIVEADVSLTLVRDRTTPEGDSLVTFEPLDTVRARTPIFFLTWQIMHPIDETSPLFGETPESLRARRAQVVVVLKGLDETFSQTIHARTSYGPEEIVWGARLADMFTQDPAGGLLIDYRRFHDIV